MTSGRSERSKKRGSAAPSSSRNGAALVIGGVVIVCPEAGCRLCFPSGSSGGENPAFVGTAGDNKAHVPPQPVCREQQQKQAQTSTGGVRAPSHGCSRSSAKCLAFRSNNRLLLRRRARGQFGPPSICSWQRHYAAPVSSHASIKAGCGIVRGADMDRSPPAAVTRKRGDVSSS